MELKPYQYREDSVFGSLTITARVILSEAQHNALGKLPTTVKVIRSGIDKVPIEMELQEVAWSKSDNEIKEEIRLPEKERKRRLPILGWINNLSELAVKQSLIIDELLDLLISEGIIKEEDVNDIKDKITRDEIRNKKRVLYQSQLDLGEFASIED